MSEIVRSARLWRLAAALAVGGLLVGCQTADKLTTMVLGPDGYDRPLIETVDPEDLGKQRVARKLQVEAGEKRGFDGRKKIREDGLIAPIDNPVMDDYLNGILQKMLAHWSGPLPEIDLEVVDHPSVNAYALPDGTIVLFRGAVERAESEDELAALLGHEAGHLLLNHFERTDFFENQKKVTNTLMQTGVVAAAVIAKTQGVDADGVDTAAKVAQSAFVADLVSKTILDPGWNRQQEEEADFLAQDLMARAGYNPGALHHVLERMADEESRRKTTLEQVTKYYKYHLDRLVQNGQVDAAINSMQKMLLHSAGAAYKDLMDQLERRHATPEARMTTIAGYQQNFYMTKLFTDLQSEPLESFRAERSVLDDLRDAKGAWTALSASVKEDFVTAEKTALASLDNRNDPNPVARYVLYSVRKAQRRDKTARLNLEIAAQSENAPQKVLETLVKDYLDHRESRKAQALALRMERDISPAAGLPYQAHALVQQGRYEEAIVIRDRCMALKNKSARAKCAVIPGLPRMEEKNAFQKLFGEIG